MTFNGADILSKRLYKKFLCSCCGGRQVEKTDTIIDRGNIKARKPTLKEIIHNYQLSSK